MIKENNIWISVWVNLCSAKIRLRRNHYGPELLTSPKRILPTVGNQHPTPAEFLRTMEDASAVDLD